MTNQCDSMHHFCPKYSAIFHSWPFLIKIWEPDFQKPQKWETGCEVVDGSHTCTLTHRPVQSFRKTCWMVLPLIIRDGMNHNLESSVLCLDRCFMKLYNLFTPSLLQQHPHRQGGGTGKPSALPLSGGYHPGEGSTQYLWNLCAGAALNCCSYISL